MPVSDFVPIHKALPPGIVWNVKQYVPVFIDRGLNAKGEAATYFGRTKSLACASNNLHLLAKADQPRDADELVNTLGVRMIPGSVANEESERVLMSAINGIEI